MIFSMHEIRSHKSNMASRISNTAIDISNTENIIFIFEIQRQNRTQKDQIQNRGSSEVKYRKLHIQI
jgi:hypothetical protein